MLKSALLAIGASLLFMAIVQCCPVVMTYVVVFGGLLLLAGLTVVVFLYQS